MGTDAAAFNSIFAVALDAAVKDVTAFLGEPFFRNNECLPPRPMQYSILSLMQDYGYL